MSRRTITTKELQILQCVLNYFRANAEDEDFELGFTDCDSPVVRAEVEALDDLLNDKSVTAIFVEQDTADLPVPKVVIEVSGGVAECTDDGGCEVEIIDHDHNEAKFLDAEGAMLDAANDVSTALFGTLSRSVLDGFDCDDMLDAGQEWLGVDHPAVVALQAAIDKFEAVSE